MHVGESKCEKQSTRQNEKLEMERVREKMRRSERKKGTLVNWHLYIQCVLEKAGLCFHFLHIRHRSTGSEVPKGTTVQAQINISYK